jgi:murein DD-endopeptidase MepM/ murein hydrolase activator NlpD
MSHLSRSYDQHAGSHSRPAPHRTQSAAAVSRQFDRSHARLAGDYMLVHGGRQVRIGPVLFWIVVGTLVIMGVWSIATGTYFAFHDDVLKRLVSRQAKMQFAYEDRIAELRAQVDRITGRQLLDQEQFEKKLNTLLHRQSVLEQHSAILSDDRLVTGSIGSPHAAKDALKPLLGDDALIFETPPGHQTRLQSRLWPVHPVRIAQVAGAGLSRVLAHVSSSLDKVEERQTAALTYLEQRYDGKVHRIRGVLIGLGIDAAKVHSQATGGPYVPLKAPPAAAGLFAHQLYRVNVARAEADQYTQTLKSVPLRKPVHSDIDISSPFGMRLDPFLGRPELHTGIDLRGEVGEPVRATATGKVVVAGWDGGYGNMVEIDHGNGFSTRYGHLSKLLVKAGQFVRIGETIGRIGSTGRSTGPHLHYETRIDGKPVDPQKFLRAGLKLGSAL